MKITAAVFVPPPSMPRLSRMQQIRAPLQAKDSKGDKLHLVRAKKKRKKDQRA